MDKYESAFRTYNQALVDIEHEYAQEYPAVSPKLNELVKQEIWQPKATKYSQVTECYFIEDSNNSIELIYNVIAPRYAEDVKVYKQNSFQFWNEVSANYFCWMKFIGPSHIYLNTTSNCMKEIQSFWITDDTLSGYSCVGNNSINFKEQLYARDFCDTSIDKYPVVTQQKLVEGSYYVYCYGSTIAIENVQYQCPKHVFEIPLTKSWYLDGFAHLAQSASKVFIDPQELAINRKIQRELNIQDPEKVYGESLALLDNAYNSVSNAVNKLKSSSQIKLREMPSLMTPIEGIRSTINKVVDYVEEGLAVMAVLGVLAILIIAMPFITTLWNGSVYAGSSATRLARFLMKPVSLVNNRKRNIKKTRNYVQLKHMED